MKKIKIIFVFILFSLPLWVFWIEPSRTIYKKQDLQIEGLPKELAGLKIALISDIHLGSPYVDIKRLKDIVKNTNAHNPDLILLLGDYVSEDSRGGTIVSPEHIFSELNELKAKYGVYAVMGNHDWWHGYKNIVDDLYKYAPDIKLLEDKVEIISYNSNNIALLGITDFNEGPHEYKNEIKDLTNTPVLAFTHSPDIFPELSPEILLTFAGHTHGGQVYIPLIGRPVVPSRYGDKYAIGLIEENSRYLFVSAGIGTSILGVRFLNPPEVNILTLR